MICGSSSLVPLQKGAMILFLLSSTQALLFGQNKTAKPDSIQPNSTQRGPVRLYKTVNLGFEHFIYSSDRYTLNLPATHSIKTEQKIFLMFYLEDKQRRGRYN